MAALQRPALPFPRNVPRPGGAKGWLIGAIALVIVIALVQVNQFSRLTSTGYEIESLRRERDTKAAQNHELEAEVGQLSSLARVDIEARTRLRMEPAKRRLYISVNQPAPDRRALPTRYLAPQDAPSAPASGAERSLWQRIRDLLPF